MAGRRHGQCLSCTRHKQGSRLSSLPLERMAVRLMPPWRPHWRTQGSGALAGHSCWTGRGFSCLQRLVQANLKCFPPSCLMKCANPLLVLHRAQASRYERRWKKTNRPWTPASGSPLPPGGAFMHPHTARGPGSQARTASHQESVTIVCPGFSLSVMAAISAM